MSSHLGNARMRLVASGPQTDPRRLRPAPNEDEVLDAIERGDGALGSELCERLLGVVDATLVRVLGRREADFDDLVQTSFEQIVITIYAGQFSRRCSLSTWAAAIASNVALHAIRRRKTERNLFDAFEDVEEAAPSTRRALDPEASFLVRQDLQRVRRHLSLMSERLARTLMLHDMLGCGIEETAEILGVSAAAAQSRLTRGRRELTRRLQKDDLLRKDDR